MLIDRFMPRFDVRSRYEIDVDAPPEETFRAAVDLDLSGSIMVKILFGLRSIPRLFTGGGGPPATGALTLDTIKEAGFLELGLVQDEEVVLGVVGQFWKANSGIRHVAAEDFTQFELPGYAKSVINLRVRPHAEGSRLTTETRVLSTDAMARRKFGLYWALIGPFSGVIRGEMLRTIKSTAEREARTSVGGS